ncbi:unnamed protein product [Chrysoparadoxa australica]
MTIAVQNVAERTKRFTIVPPASGSFKLNHEPVGSIAPGLDVRAVVEFQVPPEVKDIPAETPLALGDVVEYRDRILVISGKERVEIPLVARRPEPDIRFHDFINFGSVGEGSRETRQLTLTNHGSRAASFQLSTEVGARLKITPSKGLLLPGRSYLDVGGASLPDSGCTAVMQVELDTVGCESHEPFRTLVSLDVAGQPMRVVDVSASVVGQKLLLLDGQGEAELSFFDFGSVHFGSTSKICAVVLNDCPRATQFQFTLNGTEESAAPELPFSLSPRDGTIPAYSRLPVVLQFLPKKEPQKAGFKHGTTHEDEVVQHNAVMQLQSIDSKGLCLEVPVMGRAVVPGMQVSQRVLRFGETKCFERQDILVTLHNAGELPLRYRLRKIANMNVYPLEGVLQPQQDQSTVFTYAPTQLGSFKGVIKLELEHGADPILIRVMGTCEGIGEKPGLIGGTDKLPEHFQPKFKFVKSARASETKAVAAGKTKWERPKPYDSVDLEGSLSWDESESLGGATGSVDETIPGMTYSKQELQRREEHRDKYRTWLVRKRLKREQQELEAKLQARATRTGRDWRDHEGGVEIGMERWLPEEEPIPMLPRMAEGLYLQVPLEQLGKGSQEVRVDMHRPITKKFKSEPSTQAEVRDCAARLSREEMTELEQHFRVIDFGKVTVGSRNLRNFALTNHLTQAVRVEIVQHNTKELAGTSPQAQVIPGLATAGFDICFRCMVPQAFRKMLQYSVNGGGNEAFTVLANVVPVNVELSKHEMVMEFEPDSLKASTSQALVLTNPGNAPCSFSWAAKGVFSVVPESGTIAENKKMEVMVVWEPGPGCRTSEKLVMHVEGGKDQELAVVGSMEEARCRFVMGGRGGDKEKSSVDFGTVVVGSTVERKLQLQNLGKSDAVFFVDDKEFALLGLTAHPVCGKVAAKASVEIMVTLCSKHPLSLENRVVSAFIRGGRQLKVQLLGEVIMPELSVAEEKLEFGELAVGAVLALPVTLSNSGSIPASVLLNLLKYPDFHLVPQEGLHASHGSSVELLGSSSGAALAPRGGSFPSLAASAIGAYSPTTRRWRMQVAPGSSLTFKLLFEPLQARVHSFVLPLGLEGMNQEDWCSTSVTAISTKSSLTFDPLVLDFGDRIVPRDPAQAKSYQSEMLLTNSSQEGRTWVIDDSCLKEEGSAQGASISSRVFFISPTQGDLGPGEQVKLRIVFTPRTDHDYDIILPVYLEGLPEDLEALPYLQVGLRGSGVYPRLDFACKEVVIPTVPLGVTGKAQFQVLNNGFSDMELSYRLPLRCPVALDVNFPDGKQLGVGKESITVEVSFQSGKAVSFSAPLNIFDTDGGQYSISVTGCADNCLLTNSWFVEHHRASYEFHTSEGKPVQFMSKDQIKALEAKEFMDRQASRSKMKGKGEEMSSQATAPSAITASAPDGALHEGPVKMAPEPGSIKVLASWLSANVMSAPVESFPGDFIASHGKLAVKAVETMSSKSIPGQVWKKIASAPEKRVSQLLGQYSAFLKFLKGHGCLLHGIQSENLLAQEDYTCAKRVLADQTRTTPTQQRRQEEIWAAAWPDLSTGSWATVMYQAIRVFMLSRVTPKALSTMPGVFLPAPSTKAGGDPELTGSNVYSVGESILLKWVAYFINQASKGGATCQLKDFSVDFGDGAALCQLIASHASQLNEPGECLHKFIPIHLTGELSDQANREANAGRVLAAMAALRMDLCLESSNFLQPCGRDMVLLALHLFQSLPQIVPKSDIEFKATLGEAASKTIELTNPSNRDVSYEVTLEGSSDFSVERQRVSLEPRETVDFVVNFTPRFSAPVTARLTFWASPQAGVMPRASSIVFLLKSKVERVKPLAQMTHQSVCYEESVVELTVANPFDGHPGAGSGDNRFAVSIQQEKVAVHPRLLGGPTGAGRAGAGRGSQRPRQGSMKMAAGKRLSVDRSRLSLGKDLSKGKGDAAASATGKQASFDEEVLAEAKRALALPFSLGNVTSVTFLPGATATISLHLLPFSPGTFKCTVMFEHPRLGEFAHEVIATVDAPTAVAVLDVKVTAEEAKGSLQWNLLMPSKNLALQGALTSLVERYHAEKKSKFRAALAELTAMPATSSEEPGTPFQIETDSPYFQTYGDQIPLQMEDKKPGGSGLPKNAELATPRAGAAGAAAIPNCALIGFRPKAPGTYNGRLYLQHVTAHLVDMRTVDIRAVVGAPQVSTVLAFTAPTGQKITQDIPIHNSSGEPWVLTAGPRAAPWSGPPSLTVPAKGSASYALTFAPSKVMAEPFTSKLLLSDERSKEAPVRLEFELQGTAEEPLAEGHRVVHCVARDKVVEKFAVSNPCAREVTYQVESDLPGISGLPTLVIPAKGVAEYELGICPMFGGTFTGSLTFALPGGDFTWFTVELHASNPLEEDTIEISSVVHKAVSVEILLANPVDRELEFEVLLEGQGIMGEPSFVLGSCESGTYTLYYSPLIPQDHTARIAFINQVVGEFWYRLLLHADPAPPVYLASITCAVGAAARLPVSIDNPTGSEIVLSTSVTNRRNFDVEPAAVVLPPYATGSFDVIYTPSTLGEAQHSQIILQHPELGDWMYNATGQGEMPGVMAEHNPQATVKETSSYMFAFRNAFDESLLLDVVLRDTSGELGELQSREAETEAETELKVTDGSASKKHFPFELLLKKSSGLVLGPFQALQIPVSFSPKLIMEAKALVEVRGQLGGRALTWVYPLRGIAEAPSSFRAFSFLTAAKTSLREEIEVVLQGLADVEAPEEFSFQVVTPEGAQAITQKLVDRSLSITPLKTAISKAAEPLRFQVSFDPLRPFHAAVDLVILRKSGGRWRYEVKLEATEPAPDDSISIEAAVKSSGSVAFRLCNRYLGYAPFQAYFTGGSSLSLSVSPNDGVLAPFGSDGTTFTVTYAPLEYSENQRGQLVVLTDEVQWTYQVTSTSLVFLHSLSSVSQNLGTDVHPLD